MAAATLSKDDRYLTYLSLLFGGAAMLAYPAAVANPGALILVFAAPMALATTGRLRRSRAWQSTALVAGLTILLAAITRLWVVAEAALLIGGPVALLVVGGMIRVHDRLGAIVWLALSASAYLVGILLVASGQQGLGVTPAIVAVATVFAGLRIARSVRNSA